MFKGAFRSRIFSSLLVRSGAAFLLPMLIISVESAEAKSLCACLQERTCLPPPQAIILCRVGATTVYYTREALMTKDARAEELLNRLRAGNAAERTNAATDLGVLGFTHPKVGAALVGALKRDESKWVRRAAAKSIARLRIPDAVSALRAAANDRDEYVAHSAQEALRRFGQGEQLASNDTL